ncbi:MAG: TMEM165/GDT1 family protein [Gammaproteobacteria bacterium]
MNWQVFFTIFATVFLAELGDKTQLATMLFATDREVSKTMVFAAASAALIVASAIGVLAGSMLSAYINPRILQSIAGVSFVVIGVLTLVSSWRAV